MNFTYSICYPDKETIEYKKSPLSNSQVMEVAKNYPWQQQLMLADSLNQELVYFSPSLDFTCIKNKRSLALTADMDDQKNLQFSLWYNRPKKVKAFFGLFGETEKMVVDDAWSFSLIDSLKYLEFFVEGKYDLIEELYQK